MAIPSKFTKSRSVAAADYAPNANLVVSLTAPDHCWLSAMTPTSIPMAFMLARRSGEDGKEAGFLIYDMDVMTSGV